MVDVELKIINFRLVKIVTNSLNIRVYLTFFKQNGYFDTHLIENMFLVVLFEM